MANRKFPTFSQWKQFFKTLKKSEKSLFLALFVLAIISVSFLSVNFYFKLTKLAPAYGGTFVEGLVGQPRFINPIYGETNDIDRSLIGLVYSGLMTYDKDGQLAPDLAKEYSVSENGKIYTFILKDDLFWQDGTPLTVDDIIYTIGVVQNSDYKSPLRANWLNVEAKKTSANSLTLSLPSPYHAFLETCTLKIIPQHVWKTVLPENFSLSSYNLQPIGSGPYAVSGLNQSNSGFISSIELSSNKRYYKQLPYIQTIYFDFFENKEDLIKSANQKNIDGFAISSLDNNESLAEKEIKQGWSANEKFNIYSFSLPRYFAVFLNTQKSRIFSDPNINQALNYSFDRNDFLSKVSSLQKSKVSLVNSPIMPDYFGLPEPSMVYDYDLEAAKKLLDKAGFKEDNSGKRFKASNKKPAFQFKSYLKQGSSGTEVSELQSCLTRLDEGFKNLMSGEANGKYGIGTENAVTEFQKKYLPETKPTGETGPGTRTKLNELCFSSQNNSTPLEFTLTTINQPQLMQVADILKDYWQKAGVTVNINSVGLSELKNIIKSRDYDALLYGESLSSIPDLYPFWHSTQINDPGLNLSSYQNKTADQLLRDVRESLDQETITQKYGLLQDTILKDAPAVFLYNPDYVYWVSGKIKGIDTAKIIDPAKRFENINNWFIKTHRIWK